MRHVIAGTLLILSACADAPGITIPAPGTPPLTTEGASLGSYGIPIVGTNGWSEPEMGWLATPLVVPANKYVLVEISGQVSYSFNADCRIGSVPCPRGLENQPTGPLYDGGASKVFVAFERAGGGMGGEAVMYPSGDAAPQAAAASYRMVYFDAPRRVYLRREITRGGSWDPLLGTYDSYQYGLSSHQQLTLKEVPQPLEVTGPTTVAPGQKGRFSVTLPGGLRLRIPDGAGSGNFDLVTWEFLKSDTLPHETWREIWPLSECTGKQTCEFNPGEGVAGRLRAFAWVEGVRVLRKSEVIRVQAADLQLSCNGQITRGDSLRCTVSAQPSGTLDSIRWQFVDSAGHTTTHGDSTWWGGVMVVGGRLRVEARVNGLLRSVDTTVAVRPRTWTSPLPTRREFFMRCDSITPVCFQLYPPVHERHLGTHLLQPRGIRFIDRAAHVSDGPNSGWSYMAGTDSPMKFTEHMIVLNDILKPDNHDAVAEDFWAERPQCDRAEVLDEVRTHERRHADLHDQRRDTVDAEVERVLAFLPLDEFRATLDVGGAEAVRIMRLLHEIGGGLHRPEDGFDNGGCDIELQPNSGP
jgi:hypothetical protein